MSNNENDLYKVLTDIFEEGDGQLLIDNKYIAQSPRPYWFVVLKPFTINKRLYKVGQHVMSTL